MSPKQNVQWTSPIQLGHSPDADDAFMFYALAKNKIETYGLQFEHVLRDIQTLNTWAEEGKLDTTAISVHAYAYVADKYAVLTHGASMGDGYGPLIIAGKQTTAQQLEDKVIAVPGMLTSAYLALKLFLPNCKTVVMDFDAIMPAVIEGKVEAGVIIHEGQLTHPNYPVTAVQDLGAWWKNDTGLPLPLGINTIRKDLPEDVKTAMSQVMHHSIAYSLEHRSEALEYALSFGRGVDTDTADKFVGMYVNDWTLDMGEAGQRSIKLFLTRAYEQKLIPSLPEFEFVS